VQKLEIEDYFRYASEYREWLLSSKGIHTSTLKTDEARAMFSDFVHAWNKGKLSARYYAGIEPTSVASSSRTEHRWSFKGIDSGHLASIRNEVNRATSAGKSTIVSGHEEDDLLEEFGPSSSSLPPPMLSSRDWQRDREQREREEDHLRKERREFRKSERDVEEELAPRATGRDRIYEKRREENHERKSYRAQRNEDATIDPYDDSASKSVIDHTRSQEAIIERRKAERAAATSERVAVAQAKEDKVMAQLREMARNAGHKV
jgi:hypothetical protein